MSMRVRSSAVIPGTLTVTANVFASETSANYTYNPRGELIQVMRSPVGEEQYSYDPNGNRTTDQKASDYAFNPLNQLTAGNGALYTYDANGNRTTNTDAAGITHYSWSAENSLTRIDFPDGGFAEYAYDPFGRRIQKRIVAAGGTETIRRYVYDREDVLFELDGNGAVVTEYLHGPGIDEPLSMRREGKRYYYHQDALGSIVAITDQTGTLVQRYEYDAYGNITYTLDPAFKQPYAFTGREYDEESGLYYYRARYYDPKVGRFISRDPIGFAGGDVNLYGYVLNDPVNGVDSSGLSGSWWGKLLTLLEGGHILELLYNNLVNVPGADWSQEEQERWERDRQEIWDFNERIAKDIEDYRRLNKQAEELIEWLKRKRGEEPDT